MQGSLYPGAANAHVSRLRFVTADAPTSSPVAKEWLPAATTNPKPAMNAATGVHELLFLLILGLYTQRVLPL